MPVLPLAAGRGGHPVDGLQRALVSVRAVLVGRANVGTRAVGAKERRAIHKSGFPTSAMAVAGPGRDL